jgi:NAD(P)-dependent dehydrogenase (short-subunit alcohol dehydrogenase family)
LPGKDQRDRRVARRAGDRRRARAHGRHLSLARSARLVADLIAKGELDLEAAVADQPIGRLGRDEGIAGVLWLCGPAAGFVVGVAFPVDGGYVAR